MAFPHLPCTLTSNTQHPDPISHRLSHSTPPSSTVRSLTTLDLFDRKPLEVPLSGSSLSLVGDFGPNTLSFVAPPVAEICRRNLLQLVTSQGKTPLLMSVNLNPLHLLPNRPPPEPPPLVLVSWAKNPPTSLLLQTYRNPIPYFRKSECPPLNLFPIRPPPKPTWIESRSSVKAPDFGDFDRLLIGVLYMVTDMARMFQLLLAL